MLRSLLLLAVGFVAPAFLLRAEPVAGDAEVSAVRFKLVRPSTGATDAWLEAEVDVNARPAAGSVAGLLPRVRVTLTLAAEERGVAGAGASGPSGAGGSGPARLRYFRASAEAVALRAGHNSLRFYLPPETVALESLRGEPRLWSAEVVATLRAKAELHTSFSNALSTTEARRNFTAGAGSGAAENDGVLLPQALTPFANDYPGTTPTLVRRTSGN